MKIIRFLPSGRAISDFEISKYVDEIMSSNEKEFHVSTHLVIDEIRARIKEKKINLNDIQIYITDNYNCEYLFTIDKDGRSKNWQDSQEVQEKLFMRIL